MTDSNNWTLLPFLRDSAGVDTMVTACGIRLDISRQRLTGEDLKRLVDHCRTRGVEEAHRRMMAGEIVNPSEGRAALHTSLRSFSAGGRPRTSPHARLRAPGARGHPPRLQG